MLTGHAVADHPVAAGVGRQAATDDRAATRAPVQREQKALVAGSLLDDLDRRAGQRGEGGGSWSTSSTPLMRSRVSAI